MSTGKRMRGYAERHIAEKPMTADDLSRPYKLDVDAAGNVFIRNPGASASGLTVFSTNTREEAEQIRVLHCQLARDDSGIYTLNDPPRGKRGAAAIAYLDAVSKMFRLTYQTMVCAERARAFVAQATGSEHIQLGVAAHAAVERALREGMSLEDAVRVGALAGAPNNAFRQVIKNITLMAKDLAKGAGPRERKQAEFMRLVRQAGPLPTSVLSSGEPLLADITVDEAFTIAKTAVFPGDLRAKGDSRVRVLSVNVEDGDAKVHDLATKRKRTMRLVNLSKEYELVERNYGVEP